MSAITENEKVQQNSAKPLETNKPVSLTDFQPKSLLEAVNVLVKHTTPEQREYIQKHGMSMTHFTFGMNIRNAWGLWHDSDLAQHFKNVYGLGHADDMSGMILSAYEADIRGTGFDSEAKAQYYKDYWRKQGIDPLTLKRVA